MPHHYNPNYGAFTRQSPTGGDSGSSYSEQGRTILPPLTIAFPTSDSPGSLFNDVEPDPHLNSTPFAPFDTVSNNYPTYPTAQRSTPVPEPPYCMLFLGLVNAVPLTSSLNVKTHLRLRSSSRHMHHTPRTPRTLRTSSFPMQDTIAVTVRRSTAALTTEPRLPLVQLILGDLRVLMSQTTEGRRDSHITRLMLTCRYHLHQVITGPRIQYIPLLLAFRNINPLQALLTHQGIIPLRLEPRSLQPIRTITSSLWQ